MAQRLERALKGAEERKLGPRLATLHQVTQEMRAVYREARMGKLEVSKAGTLFRMLERLRFALAATDLEGRLDRIEDHLDMRDGAVGMPRNGAYGPSAFKDGDGGDDEYDDVDRPEVH